MIIIIIVIIIIIIISNKFFWYIPHRWIVLFVCSDWLAWKWLTSTLPLRAAKATESCIKNLISNHFFVYWQKCTDFFKFLCGIYSVHTNIIIYLSVGESGRYLPSCFAARLISPAISPPLCWIMFIIPRGSQLINTKHMFK